MSRVKKFLVFLPLLGLLIAFIFWEDRVTGFEDATGPWSVGALQVNDLSLLQKSIGSFIIDSANSQSPFNADFVADPFFIKDSSGIHLFVEHVFKAHGDISYFHSKDMKGPFLFKEVVLDEEFHLSYPQVFHFQNRYYMLPETQGAKEVILYEADSFPSVWVKKKVLLQEAVQDPTLWIVSESEIYLFGSYNDRLHCWKSNSLFGPYEKVAHNLLVGIEARSGGRIFEWEGITFLPVQNASTGYGTGISLYEITLQPEVNLKRAHRFFMGPRADIPDFSHGMHHLDIQKIGGSYWVAYDGNNSLGKSRFNWKFFLKYNGMNLWNELIN